MDVPVARQAVRPAWLNARTVLGVVLFSLALVGGQRLLASSTATTTVWSAARDLPAGARLSTADVTATSVRLPDSIRQNYVRGTVGIAGATLLRSVRAGELLGAEWVASTDAGTSFRSLTIPVTPEHAVGGSLRTGDRIDVYATFDAGDVRARTILVARAVEVLETVTAGGLVVGEDGIVGITIAVRPEDAARLAFAIRNGEIDVARLHGSGEGSLAASVDAGDLP